LAAPYSYLRRSFWSDKREREERGTRGWGYSGLIAPSRKRGRNDPSYTIMGGKKEERRAHWFSWVPFFGYEIRGGKNTSENSGKGRRDLA